VAIAFVSGDVRIYHTPLRPREPLGPGRGQRDTSSADAASFGRKAAGREEGRPSGHFGPVHAPATKKLIRFICFFQSIAEEEVGLRSGCGSDGASVMSRIADGAMRYVKQYFPAPTAVV
jgi:hypothetical protein